LVGVEVPKTRQIYLVLRELIASGKLRADAALPGEQALAAEHNVSRVTVRRALAGLEREGLIDRRRGAGTFVVESRAAKPMVVDLADVLSNLIEMGRSTDVRLLSFGYQDPSASVAELLRLARGERVQRSVRVRIIDGEPFSYLTTHVPERIGVTYTEPELASRPLLALLERSGVSVDHATQEVSAVLASPEVAAALNVDIGSALIALTRAVYDARGRGVEHLHAFYRPDRYALRMDLKRTGRSNGRRWAPLANGPSIAKTGMDVDSTSLEAGPRRQREKKS
jgi:GntR family transcriptional regulator